MFYERNVKYLDYLVKQEKYGNAGYIKLEARGDVCNITINVSNLRESDSCTEKVYLISNGQERELCSLELVRGKGTKQLMRQALSDIGGTGISYEALEAVRIPVSGEREIYGIIRHVEHVTEVQAATVYEEEEAPVEEEVEEQNTDDSKEQPECEILQEISERRVVLWDDKWKQLWEIYPHINPFRDEREYLSVGPNDFVILPGKYFRMANNSFLLHGYYNYKHLVLKKLEYHGEVRYYIGVPGNFYEREKQVAVMFGFESFESLEEPAHMGDYGYYLMRIEL